MSRHLPVIGLALGWVACSRPIYEPPPPSEPHAVVTVRVLHHAVRGTSSSHDTLIDGDRISLGPREAIVQGAPITSTVRVRPELARWRFASSFWHTEQRMETVYETERYPCGSQTTGYGSSTRTSTRYCSRQVTRHRWRTVRVSDGDCSRDMALAPRIDQRYVLQFDYYANDQCRARCFVRIPGPGGRFQLLPCR